ncbi:putative major capsid protein [Carnobacterium phage cd4]|uniref:Major capsid protein n=1 Tax=Carnobacterium phage cd4 TaxID=2849246 RepID=A0AAE7SQU8_9CAUD|nr:putative major capsid protein [Carnobacterium phage cd4]QXP45388.1 putative major capsid protein [Carnobacterium phage cd4]
MADATKLNQVINPEVLAPFIREQLIKNLVFSGIAGIDTTLVGEPGDTLKVPTYAYVGMAEDLKEGEDHESVTMSATTKAVTVKKAVRTIGWTDETLLSALGNIPDEAGFQLSQAIYDKVNNDCFKALTAGVPVDAEIKIGTNTDWVADALTKFGEKISDPTVLIVHPTQLATFRKDSQYVYVNQGNTKVSGVVAQIFGTDVLVSDMVAKDQAFLVRSGALEIVLKRNPTLETDRNIWKKESFLSVDQHYVAYVKNASKAVQIKGLAPVVKP